MIRVKGTKKIRKKNGKLSPVRVPRSNRKVYLGQITQFVDMLKRQTKELNTLLSPDTTKAQAKKAINKSIKQTNKEIKARANRVARDFVTGMSAITKSKLEKIIKKAINVTFAEVIDGEGLRDAVNTAIKENVSLIKTMSDSHWDKVIRAVSDNFEGKSFSSGAPTLTKRLQEIGGISENRAKLIARDQTSKLTGNLTKIRHQEAGINKYIWRTSKDERVVGNPSGLYPVGHKRHLDHWNREGNTYYYSRPPADGNPGEPIQCRCYAEAVLDMNNLNFEVIK